MTWKSYALVSGVGVIATYLVSSPPPLVDRSSARRAQAAPAQATADIQELAVRLQTRVQAETAFRQPARNPFRFAAPRQAAPAASVPLPVASLPPSAPLPTPMPMSLLGMASDDVDGVEQRTAIVKTGDDVVLVRVGESVAGYTVTKIEAAGIELTSATDGSIRRLAFRP